MNLKTATFITPFRLLVCGGRKFNNFRLVCQTLDRVVKNYKLIDLVLIHGRATGADALARRWAQDHEFADWGYPAKWTRYNNKAGPLRNKQMLELKPDLVVAFPGHEGTAHMVGIAKDAGVPVIEASTW